MCFLCCNQPRLDHVNLDGWFDAAEIEAVLTLLRAQAQRAGSGRIVDEGRGVRGRHPTGRPPGCVRALGRNRIYEDLASPHSTRSASSDRSVIGDETSASDAGQARTVCSGEDSTK